MRQNFDYVDIADYQGDMDALGRQASNIIEGLVREKKEMQRTIWQLVKAAGGRISVSHGDMVYQDERRMILEQYRDHAEDAYIFTAKYLGEKDT